jgi:hypothetical protein
MQYIPAGHAVMFDEPRGQKYPARQRDGAVAPAGQYLPTGQGVVDPAAQMYPATQASGLNEPGGQ